MTKIAKTLIGLGCAGALSLAAATATTAKTYGKPHRAAKVSHVRAVSAPPPPPRNQRLALLPPRNVGPYGLRCDRLE